MSRKRNCQCPRCDHEIPIASVIHTLFCSFCGAMLRVSEGHIHDATVRGEPLIAHLVSKDGDAQRSKSMSVTNSLMPSPRKNTQSVDVKEPEDGESNPLQTAIATIAAAVGIAIVAFVVYLLLRYGNIGGLIVVALLAGAVWGLIAGPE